MVFYFYVWLVPLDSNKWRLNYAIIIIYNLLEPPNPSPPPPRPPHSITHTKNNSFDSKHKEINHSMIGQIESHQVAIS